MNCKVTNDKSQKFDQTRSEKKSVGKVGPCNLDSRYSESIFSRVHATLHPALSVRPSVGLLARHTFTFIMNFVSLSHLRVY